MKTTFANNSIRAALVLLLSSTATPRGFQETNGNPPNHKGTPQHATPAAPGRSSAPTHTAPANHPAPAASSARPTPKPTSTPVSQTPKPTPSTSAVNSNSNTNINKNININRNTNSNAVNQGAVHQGAVNQGSSPRPNQPTPGTGSMGRGTDVGRPQGLASNGNGATNTNVNVNKNININKNTNSNSNASNQGFGSRQGLGFSGSRGTDVRGPQGSAFNGNSNTNSNTNVNINKNINVNGGDVRRGSMVRDHAPHIEESHFRSHFGREHEFHIDRPVMVAGRPGFQFGGVSFRAVDTWPASWRYSDPVYVDFVGGSYVLCNRMHPGVQIPVNIEDCASCVQTPPMLASNADCPDCGSVNAPPDGSIPTLARGQTMDQVVSIMGTPKQIVDLGMRKIFVYNDMRVTFVAGRLSDVR